MSAEILMLTGGIVAFLLTVHWVRSRDLLEGYAIGWLAVAVLLMLCGLFPNVIMTFADRSRLSYPAAVLFVALAVIYLNALAVSVTLTRLSRRTIRLTQEVALLEARLREFEASRPTNGAVAPDPEKVPGPWPSGPDV